MIYGLVLVIHVLVAFFLVIVILLQGGRGGLGETLGGAAAQSLFGGGANTVMAKITAVCASLFMITCLSLAALSTAKGQSVIDQLPASPGALPLPPPHTQKAAPATTPAPAKPAQPPQPSAPPAPSTPPAASSSTAPAPTEQTP